MAERGPRNRDTIEIRVDAQPATRLLYLEQGGVVYVIPSGPSSDWSTRAIQAGGCEVRWSDGRVAPCSARVATDPAVVGEVRSGFRIKYGEGVFAAYFAYSSRLVVLDPRQSTPPPSPAELLEGEFDAVASDYDASVARQPVERYLKDRALSFFLQRFQGRDPLLEVGPGTGYHTLPLITAGHRIIAVDVSARMLETLDRRARDAGLADRLKSRKGTLGDLTEVLEDLPREYFGGAFSAFGAFNLEADVGRLASALGYALRPQALLVFTALNRPGLTPLLWELALGRSAAARARFLPVVPAGRLRYPLELHLRTPGEWDRILGIGFRRRDIHPVSVFAPPFDSPRLQQVLSSSGARRAARLDGTLSGYSSLWPWAEWVVLTYERLGG